VRRSSLANDRVGCHIRLSPDPLFLFGLVASVVGGVCSSRAMVKIGLFYLPATARPETLEVVGRAIISVAERGSGYQPEGHLNRTEDILKATTKTSVISCHDVVD
jgi:hypothetical protein